MKSKRKTGNWLIIVGAAAMLIFGIALDWASLDLGDGVTISGNRPFDYFFTGGIAWLLVVAAGIVVVMLAVGAIEPGTTPWSLVLVLATGLATLLMLLRLILGAGEGLDRGPGMWVAFVAAALTLAGAVVNFTQSGGKFSDLTDVETMRGAFSGRGRSTPPPPPGAPPPPPPADPPAPSP